MTSTVVIFGLFVLLAYNILANTSEAPSDLILIHILYRHGDRSPTKSYPKNPYNESVWQQGLGELTMEGMKQHYALGQYFRKRYIEGQPYKLLKETYDRFQVYIRSTDYNRTLMSAYCNLAGLFPPQGSQVWNEDLLWQPIPVHTVPEDSDYLLHLAKVCDKYNEVLDGIHENDFVKEMEQRDKKFFEYIREKTGVYNLTLRDTWDVADTLLCENTHNMTLPDWANKTWDGRTTYDKLQAYTDIVISLRYSEPVLIRLSGGPLLGQVVKNMKDKRDGKSSQQKAFVYSAHDTTVSAFLSTMGIFNRIAPVYTSSVLVELFNTSGQFSVKVWYRNSTAPDAEPFQMIIPGCKASCPLDEFIELTQANIPTDWKAECNTGNMWLVITVVVVSLLLVIIGLIVIVKLIQRRRIVNRYRRLQTNDVTMSTR